MLIRSYQDTDEEQVIQLWRACNLVVPQNDPYEDIKSKIRMQSHLFFVGLLDDRLVATLMAGYEGHRGWLNYLAVAPDLQKQGLGREMVATAETALAELGCPKINLQIRSSNRSVIAFYESLGYSIDDVVSLGKRFSGDKPKSDGRRHPTGRLPGAAS